MSQATPIPITAFLLESGSKTTVSNTGGMWWLIHAPECGDYRAALDALRRNGDGTLPSDNLCSVQLRMSARYVCVEPTWCIRGQGYWYLRSTSNLGPSHPAGYGQWATLQECMDAALAWCRQAPAYREAVVHRRDLVEAGIVPDNPNWRPDVWVPRAERTVVAPRNA